MTFKPVLGILIGMAALRATSGAFADPVTVLYADREIQIDSTLPDASKLWVSPEELPRINGFEVKADGAVLGSLRVAVEPQGDGDLLMTREGRRWFNVTGLAQRLNQKFVHQADPAVWSFGPIPALRDAGRDPLEAPDFELPDRQGRPVRLSSFRGQKVLLVTWASW